MALRKHYLVYQTSLCMLLESQNKKKNNFFFLQKEMHWLKPFKIAPGAPKCFRVTLTKEMEVLPLEIV